MPKTVQEVLRESGLTDEQIQALDQKAISGFSTVLTTATKAEEDAAEKLRLQQKLYEDEIVPALNGWGNEKATITAERDFYKTQAEGAKSAGFIPKDAPGYKPPEGGGDAGRDGNGRFVANGNVVPGSPAYMTLDQGITALSNAQWAMTEHLRLFGSPMPDDFEVVLKEATANRMSFRDYASRKYKFDDKKTEIAAKKQKDHDDAIRKETRSAVEKEFSERNGNNPNLRPAAASQFASVRKAVDAGQVKDPLKMTQDERRLQTRQMIHTEMSDQASTGMVN